MGEHGYDLQALGNAISLTYGPQAAVQMARRASFPILAANFYQDGLPLLEGFQPAVSFPLPGDLRLGVIGLTVQTPEFYALFGLEIPDYRSSAGEWLEKLKNQGRGPIVVVSHLGLKDDLLLAEAFSEIDVIIGGHSHSLLEEGERSNGVLIAQAGDYARYLGRVDLEVEIFSGRVLEKCASLIGIPEDAPLDPIFTAAIAKAEEEARKLMSRPVGVLQEALDQDFYIQNAQRICRTLRADADLASGCRQMPQSCAAVFSIRVFQLEP